MRSVHSPSQRDLMELALDISDPIMGVDITVSDDKDKLWVNVDGVCILRIQRIPDGTLQIGVPV